jgi:enterobactin synthetase component D / holo-[acyl-carrier protein] synthase
MIEEILPPKASCSESFSDPADATLFPEEEALLTRAVPKRRAEFTTARHCARRALASIGVPPAPILPGERGAPRWPAGAVGSITHCAGYRAAAVAAVAHLTSVGIDAEPHAPLPQGVLKTIALPTEIQQLDLLSAVSPDIHWDRLLFSAKESVYKTWFPMTRRWLDFEQAEITFDHRSGTFSAKILNSAKILDSARIVDTATIMDSASTPAVPTGFAGRWMVREGLAVTAIAVEAARPGRKPVGSQPTPP